MLVEPPTFVVEQVAIVRQRRADLFRLGAALAQVGLAGLLQDALVGERLLLAVQVFAHALKARAQRRQHRLLPLEGGGALLHLAGLRVHELLRRFDLLALGAEPHVLFVEACGLLFEVARVALELLEFVVDLRRPAFDLLLPALDAGLDAVEPNEVRLVLLLPLVERGLGGRDGLLPRDQVGQPAREVALRLLLPGREQAVLLVERLPLSRDLLGVRLHLGLALRPVALEVVELRLALVEVALAALDLAGGLVQRLLLRQDALAPLAEAVAEFLAEPRQLLARAADDPLAFFEFRETRVEVGLLAGEFGLELPAHLLARLQVAARFAEVLPQTLDPAPEFVEQRRLFAALALDLQPFDVPGGALGLDLFGLRAQRLLARLDLPQSVFQLGQRRGGGGLMLDRDGDDQLGGPDAHAVAVGEVRRRDGPAVDLDRLHRRELAQARPAGLPRDQTQDRRQVGPRQPEVAARHGPDQEPAIAHLVHRWPPAADAHLEPDHGGGSNRSRGSVGHGRPIHTNEEEYGTPGL